MSTLLRIALLAAALALAGCNAAPPEATARPGESGANASAEVSAVISNDRARTDVNGDTIDVHDGRVIRFGESLYWYGTAYGTTTGFTRANEYRVYSAPSLAGPWTPHGAILPDAPSGVYYRPHVIHDAARDKYVLWYNWYPRLWDGYFGVAESDSPTGPFEVVSTDVRVKHSDLGVGDFNLFVDDADGGAGYLMYNTIEGHRLSVERLSDDYLTSTLDNGGFIADHCEAGSVFARDGTYYLLTDYTCCFCTQGSGARVYTSDSPLGPFALRQNINRVPGTPAPRLTDGDRRPPAYHRLERSAADTFPSVELRLDGDAPVAALHLTQYTGNRAGICGDTLAAATHDPRVAPNVYVSAHVGGAWQRVIDSAPVLTERTLTNVLSVQLPAGLVADGLRVGFGGDYPYPALQLVELTAVTPDDVALDAASGAHAYILDANPLHTAPIVPAQQTFVMPLDVDGERAYLWMGDLWGSAPDNVKGHDMQYWSSPLEFYPNGLIRPLRWEGEWALAE